MEMGSSIKKLALSKHEIAKMVNGFLDLLRQKHDVRKVYLFGSFYS